MKAHLLSAERRLRLLRNISGKTVNDEAERSASHPFAKRKARNACEIF
ncbi:hypothetical protein HMPREF0658_1848 [Hoylesella marshii DSM 16973 = JCM 13450]|uniref:Uncharacterized protein n=1 Tax=Hoylesella marshii DSM 16973 = JCM 13450 TaxID=862515 RepID=E0NUJ3_9BACT|nr:hypothetical protein HMPREF0658_1848 [Hoylesella marshii DSM 16973 = JCM 13450]